MIIADAINYSVKDFLLDESFQKRVFHPTAPSEDEWGIWLKEHPDKAKTVGEAISILLDLRKRLNETIPPNDFDEVWMRITDTIDSTITTTTTR